MKSISYVGMHDASPIPKSLSFDFLVSIIVSTDVTILAKLHFLIR